MKTDEIDFSIYQELHAHKGSENYEVVKLCDKKFDIRGAVLVDKLNKNIIFYGYKEQKLERKNLHILKKITGLGDEIGKIGNSYPLMKDGTINAGDYYCNWVINGDTSKYKYLDPFTNKEIDDPYEFKAKETDPVKWLKKFNQFYHKAQYVHIYMSMYHFKIENKWYWMEANLEGLPDNFKQQYPPKEDQDVRMVELENLAPVWYHKGFKDRDTSLIKMVDYESTYFEKVDQGLNQYGFSAGWWYLEIPMPLGDTIRIKRYSNYEDPELLIYKVPGEYGGREDVLFIVQKPEELFPEQVGGMYAIRPRDPNQPQRRYKKIVYTTDAEGNETIDRSRSVESDEYKQWTNNKG
ncbi:hypothetical protein Q4603_21555 [Zobellia galactanivorans]|uniref:hypothetical protein n=1 Tax=Zobellia galactanivorans (strain DSM 12802 / CCUG 47099 / CIP 106680 / NCIMB 13871 / Dsij) TaxID=63186 RepID=UPI0026E4341B|nr:hypothetical protein [Zobellia galactanivorans]MDO6811218.1 hypothetical protein [Zobellia galactanivorans]